MSAIITSWLVKLPLGTALALGAGMGAEGAWIGLTAELVVLSALGIWRLQTGAWLRQGRKLRAVPA